MTNSGRIGRELARAYKTVDIVIFVADAIVVGFLLFLIATVAIAGTNSSLYVNTGGWLLSQIQSPGVSVYELLVYSIAALAVAGPIWHGLVRSAPKTAGSGTSDTDSFEFKTVDESFSSEAPDSGVRTANGGRRLERVRNSPYQDEADWIESVFEETAQLTFEAGGASDRSPSDDALGIDDDGAPVEDESVRTTHQPKPGNRPGLENRMADQSGSSGEPSNRSTGSLAHTTSMRQSSDVRGPAELIPTVLSSRTRIKNLEGEIEEIGGQNLIDDVERSIREKLEDGSDINSRIEPCSWDSPAMDEAVAEIQAQQRRIESAFGTEFGAGMHGDGMVE